MADNSATRASGARRLASQSAVYAVGNAIIKASGIFLAPLYLNPDILARADYGRLGLLEITGQLAILAGGLGITSALIRFASDEDADEAAVSGTALVVALASAVVMALLFSLFANPLGGWLLDDVGGVATIRWYGAYVGLQIVLFVPYGYIRFTERASLFVVARVTEIALLIGGVYYFLVVRGLGLHGVVLAFALSSAVAVVVLVAGTLRRVRFSPQLVPRLLGYGAPLAIGGLALPILHAGDRYILDHFRGAEEVALYYWGSRMAGLLNMLFVQSLSMALAVVGVKALTGDRVDVSLHRRTFRHFTVWAAWAVLALSLFAPEITRFFTDDPSYLAAAPIVLPLSLGYLFYGHYVLFSNVLLAASRTHLMALSVLISAAANVGMNFILIPPMGLYGAALATVVAYLLLASMTAWFGRSAYEIRYGWVRSVVAVVTTVVLYRVSLYATRAAPADVTPVIGLALRVAAVLAFMPLMVVLRVYPRAEVAIVWERIRGLLRVRGAGRAPDQR